MAKGPLADELAQLRTIFDALMDVVVLFRYDEEAGEGVTVWCNRAALLVTGLTREEIIGLPPRRLVDVPGELEDPAIRRRLFEVMRKEGFLEVERAMTDPSMPDGTLFRIRVYPTAPGSDLYILQTELIGKRPVMRLK